MESIKLYRKLLESSIDRLKEFTTNFPKQERQFIFDDLNEVAFENMYKNLKTVVPRQQLFNQVPGLEKACRGCWAFYFNPRNRSAKFLDIKLGKLFENVLKDFLCSIGLQCVRSEDLGFRKNYPDLVLLTDSGKHLAFLEVKYLTAPFLKVFEKVPGRECYEGSTTLDADVKFRTQKEIVEKEINSPVYYVYWIDYPCIKGVFFMSSSEVFSYVDEKQLEWTRKERDGDFVNADGKKLKVGHTEKVYLPLLKMRDFEALVQELAECYKTG